MVNQGCMSLSTYYLEYGRHVGQLRCRRRHCAYAPTSNTASHDNHEKINSWVSFSFLYEYGAPLLSLKKIIVKKAARENCSPQKYFLHKYSLYYQNYQWCSSTFSMHSLVKTCSNRANISISVLIHCGHCAAGV